MENTMKFNVTIVNPFLGRNEVQMNVAADRIDFDANTFRFNPHYNACEIVAIEEVSPEYTAAMAGYFVEFGTACE